MALRQTLLGTAFLAGLSLSVAAGAAAQVQDPSSPSSANATPAAAPANATDSAADPAAVDAAADDTTATSSDEAAANTALPLADGDVLEDEDDAGTPARIDWRQRVRVVPTLAVDSKGNEEGDRVLRIVTRADTGKAAAAKVGGVAMALLGGNAFRTNVFSKNQLGGEQQHAVPSPTFGTLPGLIRARLDAYFREHPGAIPKEERVLVAAAGPWSLVYQKLSDGSTPYELHHEASITFPVKRKLFKANVAEGVKCVDEARVAPLENWQADRYALVKATSRQLAEACVARLVAELPRLFPDPDAPAVVATPATAPTEGAPAPAAAPAAPAASEASAQS